MPLRDRGRYAAQQQCRSTLQCPQCCKARIANTARFRERRAEGQRRAVKAAFIAKERQLV
jgi:hypothetical protein